MREQIVRYVPPRASRTTTSYPFQQDIEEDDSYYPHRPLSSARIPFYCTRHTPEERAQA
jgi:hypothetical protein